MSPPSLLVSLLLLVVVLISLASVSGESVGTPSCPFLYQSQEGNPPGWPSDWGFASTGTYDAAAIIGSVTLVLLSFNICVGSGCGPACCWHANGFAFWVGPYSMESNSTTVPSCSVNVNFNGDSRTYTVDPVKLDAINYIGVDGFMANEGNWVQTTITCNIPVIGMFSNRENPDSYNTCGGIPAPAPSAHGRPHSVALVTPGRRSTWTAGATPKR
jgi:hypothetical protein